MDAEDLFAGHDLALAVLSRVRAALADCADVTEQASRSQVAFRRGRGFAYLWRPGQYLAGDVAEVVMSIACPSTIESPRFKQVVHPGAHTFMHHLEIRDLADMDAEVVGWLHEAWQAAG